jgi:hypothetical protein
MAWPTVVLLRSGGKQADCPRRPVADFTDPFVHSAGLCVCAMPSVGRSIMLSCRANAAVCIYSPNTEITSNI